MAQEQRDYHTKQLKLEFEEALDDLVAEYIQKKLPLFDISYTLDLKKFSIDEVMMGTED